MSFFNKSKYLNKSWISYAIMIATNIKYAGIISVIAITIIII